MCICSIGSIENGLENKKIQILFRLAGLKFVLDYLTLKH